MSRSYSVVLAAVLLLANGQNLNNTKTYLVEVHQNVSIPCDGDIPLQDTFLLDAKEIVWTFKSENSDDQSEVSMPHNARSIDCIERGISDCLASPVLSFMQLENVTSSNYGTYTCYLKRNGHETPIQANDVIVGYTPREPLLLRNGCTLQIMRDVMTCCWDIQAPTYVPTNYTMTYKPVSEDGSGLTKSEKCFMRDSVCCKINIENHYIIYELFLTSKNIFGISTSVKHHILPSWHSKSDPPTGVQLETKVDGTVCTIIVSWNPPKPLLTNAFDYKIRVADAKTNAWTTEFGNKETQHTLEHLKSSTLYTVQVAARPVSMYGVNKGMWSDWSKSVSIRTNVAAPSKNLYFFRPNTTVVSLEKKRYFVVDLKWSPYGNEIENGFASKIDCETNSEKKSFSLQNGTTVRFSTTAADILCHGAYCNIADCSEYDTVHITHQNISAMTKNVEISFLNETALVFQWNFMSSQGVCSAKLCSRERTLTDNVTLSKEPERECLYDGFNLEQTEQLNCSKGVFTMSRDFDPCLSYVVIVQVFHKGNGLILQSEPSGLRQYNPEIGKISEFRASDRSTVHLPEIEVSWDESDFTPNSHLQPQLWYQVVGGSECSGNIKTTCGKTFCYLPSPNKTFVTIPNNVYGGTNYEVSYRLVCNRNAKLKHEVADFDTFSMAANNAVATVVTTQTAPTPPCGASFTRQAKSRQLLLEWKPPLHENGQTVYHVTKIENSDPKAASTYKATKEKLIVDVDCKPSDNGTLFSFIITSVNVLADGSLLEGGSTTIEDVPCLEAADSRPNVAILISGVCTSALTLLLFAVFLCYHRNTVKLQLKKRLNSPPKPAISQGVSLTTGETGIAELSEKSKLMYESFQMIRKDNGDSDCSLTGITSGDNIVKTKDEEIFHKLPNYKIETTEHCDMQPLAASSVCENEESLAYTDVTFTSATTSDESGSCLIKQYVRVSEPMSLNGAKVSEYERLQDASTPTVEDEYAQDSTMAYVIAPSPV